jgi:hypothetical protein
METDACPELEADERTRAPAASPPLHVLRLSLETASLCPDRRPGWLALDLPVTSFPQIVYIQPSASPDSVLSY